jgi:hypothetical protein
MIFPYKEETANKTYWLEKQYIQVGLGWKVLINKKQGIDEKNEGKLG